MKAQAARKPISMMSSRILQIVPDLGASLSMDSLSPGGQFTKAEGDDVSCKSMYGTKSKKKEDDLTLDELKTIEMHRKALLLRVRMSLVCYFCTDRCNNSNYSSLMNVSG